METTEQTADRLERNAQEATEPAKLHCARCLQGQHSLCRIYTPAEWEGGGGRCVCKCAVRNDTRLTNVERKCEAIREKAPRKPRGGGNKGTTCPTKWSDDRLRELVRLSATGMTSRQVGVEVGAHMDIVRTYLAVARKKGITI